MKDRYGREIHYLRISVTQRCNLNCKYCRTANENANQKEQTLTTEEILQILQIIEPLGIDTIRLTGGEPLLREDLEILIKEIKKLPWIQKVTLTTNGVLLREQLPKLIESGLDGVNVSLDTLNQKRFKAITGVEQLQQVLEGIYLAEQAGISVKCNCVGYQNFSTCDIEEFEQIVKYHKVLLRFIELMPIGAGQVEHGISNDKIFHLYEERYGKLSKSLEKEGDGPAVYYEIPNFIGKIGFISAVHHKFCQNCNRIRLTSDGVLKPCLSYGMGLSIADMLREKKTHEEIRTAIWQIIYQKPQSHQFEKIGGVTEKRGMNQIGG